MLAPRPTPKLEDHPSSAVRGCLFNLFTATRRIGGRSSIRNLRTRHAVVTETHIHGRFCYTDIKLLWFCLESSGKFENTVFQDSDMRRDGSQRYKC
jgi:hypothetical protein